MGYSPPILRVKMSATPSNHEHPIRRARLARRWSQQELGQRRYPPATKAAVSQWESDTTQPEPKLGLQLVDLFEGEFSLEDLYRRERSAA